MKKEVICHVKCPNYQVANSISDALVKEDLCKAVKMIPGAMLFKRGEKEVECHQEVICMVKTTRALFTRVSDRVREIHPEEAPELISSEVYHNTIEWDAADTTSK